MVFPGAGKIARRFGITLACVLAARGCATEIESYAHVITTSKPAPHATLDVIVQSLVPYGSTTITSPVMIDEPSTLEQVLAGVQYAP